MFDVCHSLTTGGSKAALIHMFEKILIQTVDHTGGSRQTLHASYEATGISATVLNNVFHCLPLEGCGSLISSC